MWRHILPTFIVGRQRGESTRKPTSRWQREAIRLIPTLIKSFEVQELWLAGKGIYLEVSWSCPQAMLSYATKGKLNPQDFFLSLPQQCTIEVASCLRVRVIDLPFRHCSQQWHVGTVCYFRRKCYNTPDTSFICLQWKENSLMGSTYFKSAILRSCSIVLRLRNCRPKQL